MSRVDAVVFDFGNVLAAIDRLAMCEAIGRHSSLDAGEIARRIWDNEIERKAETGAWDSREHFRRIRDRIEAADSWSYDEFLEEFLSGVAPNPEGLQALCLAHERGRRVFVLSNTSFAHARWLLSREEIVTAVEAFVFSFKVGVMKPDPLIWRTLLSNTGLAAERCLYVDDVADYCLAAERLGLRTVNYVRGRTDLLQELERVL